MIQSMLDGHYQGITLRHIRLAYSSSMIEVGRFRFKKIFHLVSVCLRTIYALLTQSIDIVYYPPAGPGLNPVIRDIFTLLLIRPFTKRIVFHFHAGGLSEFVETSGRAVKALAGLAYQKPSAAFQVAASVPSDGPYFNAGKVFIIPNGIEDQAIGRESRHSGISDVCRILFVGVLMKSKGIFDLLEALHILLERGLRFEASFMGEFDGPETEQQFREKGRSLCADGRIRLLGVCQSSQKWDVYARSSVLCYPSYFSSETFGLVVLEAMMFGLPVVATSWRGIPDLVDDGETGYLVPIRNPTLLGERLARIVSQPEEARRMGERGREKYLREYTLGRFHTRLEEAFVEIARMLDNTSSC